MVISSDMFTVWKRQSSSLSGAQLSQNLVTGSCQTGRVEAGTLLLLSSVGAAPGPWAPGTPETLRWRVLAHANA